MLSGSGDKRERGERPASKSSSIAMTIWIGFSGGGRPAALAERIGARLRVWRVELGLRIKRHIVSREWQKTVVSASMKMTKRIWNMSPPPTPVAARPR